MDENRIDGDSLAILAAWRENYNSNKPSERTRYRAPLKGDGRSGVTRRDPKKEKNRGM